MLTAKSLKLKANSGQLLIEALVAMGILTVAVFAVFSLLTRSTSLNRVVSQQYVATYLAAEGIELTKNILDSNLLRCGTAWNTGAVPQRDPYEVDYLSDRLTNATGGKLLINPNNGFYQYQSGDPSLFTRLIYLETISTDEQIRVTSVVNWRSRGGVENEVRLEDHFFKWRPQPEC